MAITQTLTLTQSSQSVADNASQVRILWKSTQTDASYNNYEQIAYYYVSINGGAETRYSVKYTLPKNSTKTIVDKTLTVQHTADGKGSIKVRTVMDTQISAGTIEKSSSLTLATIPRATKPTLSALNVDMGDSITINLPRASSGFTHDLAYQIDGKSTWNNIKTGAGTSHTWTTPDLASEAPNATFLHITLRVITKNGSTTVGTATAAATLKVPTSIKPTVSALTATEAVSALATQFGAYVQGKSQISCKITGAGAKGSTIKEYQATFAGKVYTTASWTSPVLTSSGTQTIKARVKDSRGRWSDFKTLDITVKAYVRPLIDTFEVYRCSADGTENPAGDHVAIKYNYTVTALNNKNTANMTIKYKKSSASSYTTLLTSTALSGNTIAAPVVPATVFSNSNMYDFKMELTDWFGVTPYTTALAVIPTEEVILDIKANGLGLAVGGVSTLNRVFDSFWPVNPRAGMRYETLETGADLNDLTETTVCRLSLDRTYYNGPESEPGGILEVFSFCDAATVMQRLNQTYKGRAVTYTRFFYDGAWGPWRDPHGWISVKPTAAEGATIGTLTIRYNPDLDLVEMHGSVTINTTDAVTAGTPIVVATMPTDLVPGVNAPLSVYRAATSSGWVKAVVNTDGNIQIRPGGNLAANASAQYFLGGMFYLNM